MRWASLELIKDREKEDYKRRVVNMRILRGRKERIKGIQKIWMQGSLKTKEMNRMLIESSVNASIHNLGMLNTIDSLKIAFLTWSYHLSSTSFLFCAYTHHLFHLTLFSLFFPLFTPIDNDSSSFSHILIICHPVFWLVSFVPGEKSRIRCEKRMLIGCWQYSRHA